MTVKQSIPSPGLDIDSHTVALMAIKEAVEQGQGNKGPIEERFLKVLDAMTLEILRPEGGRLVPMGEKSIVPEFTGGLWGETGSGQAPLRIYKDPMSRRVFFQGRIQRAGFTPLPSPFVLPVGYRPIAITHFVVAYQASGRDVARVTVNPEGTLDIFADGLSSFHTVSLDGINYVASL